MVKKMKVQTKKMFVSALLCLMILTVYAAVDTLAVGPATEDVNANSYKGNMNAGEEKQLRFRNRFQLKLKANCSIETDIEADVDGIGDREFSFEVNTSAGQKLSLKFQANNSELNMGDGAQIRTRSQNRYRYQEKFMFNASLNQTGEPLKAKLMLKTQDQTAKWAYYDEAASEWVEVESTYQDGYLVAETDHFSVWAVITPESTTAPTIDGYSAILAIAALGVLGMIVKIRKSRME